MGTFNTFYNSVEKVDQQASAVPSENGALSTLSTLSTGAQEAREALAHVYDGAWLDRQNLPPLAYAVGGLIPEGFTILIGPPKVGKSYLLGGLLLAVAAGGTALSAIDIPRPQPVFYLALEDGHRRMQARCRELLGPGEPIPETFHYTLRIEPRHVLETVRLFLLEHPDTALVVLDTLGKVMPEARPGESAYQRDYRIGGALKQLAENHPGVAFVVVHHDRKAGSDDFVDNVSGTNGLAGAADTIMVLARDRHSQGGSLKVTGRDVSEEEYAVTVDQGQWTLDGPDLSAAAQTARTRAVSEGLGDRSSEAVRLVNDNPGIGPTWLGRFMGISPKTAGVYLQRLAQAGRISKTGRGVYGPNGVENSEQTGQAPLYPR